MLSFLFLYLSSTIFAIHSIYFRVWWLKNVLETHIRKTYHVAYSNCHVKIMFKLFAHNSEKLHSILNKFWKDLFSKKNYEPILHYIFVANIKPTSKFLSGNDPLDSFYSLFWLNYHCQTLSFLQIFILFFYRITLFKTIPVNNRFWFCAQW